MSTDSGNAQKIQSEESNKTTANGNKRSEIRVLKITPTNPGTTFLSKNDLHNLLAKSISSEKQIKTFSSLPQSTSSVSQKLAADKPISPQAGLDGQHESADKSSKRRKPNILRNRRKSKEKAMFKMLHDKEKKFLSKSKRKSQLKLRQSSPEVIELDSKKSKPRRKRKSNKISSSKEELRSISSNNNNNISPLKKLKAPNCAFCHLGSNESYGIGDLYGPYKLSSSDVVKQIKTFTRNEYKIEVNSNLSPKDKLLKSPVVCP